MSNVLGLRMLPLEGECINVVEERLSLEGEIVRYSTVSRSPSLGRNEKFEQHIRKKTRKGILNPSTLLMTPHLYHRSHTYTGHACLKSPSGRLSIQGQTILTQAANQWL